MHNDGPRCPPRPKAVFFTIIFARQKGVTVDNIFDFFKTGFVPCLVINRQSLNFDKTIVPYNFVKYFFLRIGCKSVDVLPGIQRFIVKRQWGIRSKLHFKGNKPPTGLRKLSGIWHQFAEPLIVSSFLEI